MSYLGLTFQTLPVRRHGWLLQLLIQLLSPHLLQPKLELLLPRIDSAIGINPCPCGCGVKFRDAGGPNEQNVQEYMFELVWGLHFLTKCTLRLKLNILASRLQGHQLNTNCTSLGAVSRNVFGGP